MEKRIMRVVFPTGHLGVAPCKPESFYHAMETKPDFVAADGGTSDNGAVFLGTDTSYGIFEREHMETYVVGSRKQVIPFCLH